MKTIKVKSMCEWPADTDGAAYDPKRASFDTHPGDAILKGASRTWATIVLQLEDRNGTSTVEFENEEMAESAFPVISANTGKTLSEIGELPVEMN